MTSIFNTFPEAVKPSYGSPLLSRTESTLSSSEVLSLSSAESSPKAQKRGSLRSSKQNSKGNNKVEKISSTKVAKLLEKYNERSAQFKDGEFTQQSGSFLAKMASDEKIPEDIKGNFSLYYILVSIAKIFFLNEYELSILACALDHCGWNIDDLVTEEEEEFLKEFPCSLQVEITKESRRLIIYLLVLAFNLKNNLSLKEEVELIQAYCESICNNFFDLVKRSSKLRLCSKITFSYAEINQKFNFLSKKDNQDPFMKTVKNYNMVVDSILRLTGTHTTNKPKLSPSQSLKVKIEETCKASEDFNESEETNVETDLFYADFNNEINGLNVPDVNLDQLSSTYKSHKVINGKRDFEVVNEEDEQMEEENKNKKIKINEEDIFAVLHGEQPELKATCSFTSFMGEGKAFGNDDAFDIVNFNRGFSNLLQDEIPLFTRFNSNLSLFGGK